MEKKENAQHNQDVGAENEINLSSMFAKFKAGEYGHEIEETEEKARVLDAETPLETEKQGASQKEESPKKEPVKKREPVVTEEDEEESEGEAEDIKAPQEKKEDTELSSKLDKTTKRLQESQKWGNDLRVKLSNYEKKIARFQEEGVISEEEAADLLKDTYVDADEEEKEVPLIVHYTKIWDSEIENLRKYSDDDSINQSISAFQYFLNNASGQEIDSAFKRFARVQDDPIKLTKAMLDVGKKYNEEVYQEIVEVGGVKGLKSKYNEEIDKYKETIDKLEKEVLRYKKRYEDYTESNQILPKGSSPAKSQAPKLDTIDLPKMFEMHRRGQNPF